jgi:hypothetical protein
MGRIFLGAVLDAIPNELDLDCIATDGVMAKRCCSAVEFPQNSLAVKGR